MPALLLDLTHTSHTRARTGIQRVVRALHRELGESATAVTHDPYLGEWRRLEPWENENLAAADPGPGRGAHWPFAARWRSRWRRFNTRPGEAALRGDFRGFLTAELFPSAVAANLPEVFPRVAVFHDAIALRFPELSPAGTVARFPGYLQELLRFDGIAAVSEESRESLLAYWRWLGVSVHPPVRTITNGVDLTPAVAAELPTPAVAGSGLRVVLSVGTLEGRKNHLALFDACEELWARGEKFELRVIGSVQRETGQAALEKLRALQHAGRPLRYDGPLGETAVDVAYAEATFTVYPSLAEGFGLPVIESLARGRPCLCSAQGALGELSRQGGCVALPSVDAASLARAIAQLLDNPAELAALSAAARGRTFKSWRTYAVELSAWMDELPRRG
jgi:glycosyltransferase involved in cell wall biosynthesis